jgi:hypothetical protein
MAGKLSAGRKATTHKATKPRPATGTTKAVPSKRRRQVRTVPGHPAPPPELAGKWVAWSRDRRIVASDDTLAGVMGQIASKGIKGASYQLLPSLIRGR